MLVHIIDYGLSNLLSVQRAVEKVGHTPTLATSPQALRGARAIILPGVGAFRDGMAGLARLDLIAPLRSAAEGGTPILGICLGMQMLFAQSEEFGLHPGLGLIPGRVTRLPAQGPGGAPLRIPHVGWAQLENPNHPAFRGLAPHSEVYFVHSYAAQPENPAHLAATATCGGHTITAAAANGAVLGCQFHPEKSGPAGLSILQSFLDAAH